MLWILQALALAGFLASLTVHVAALAGVAAPDYAMGLHVGVFAVFVPAILLGRPLAAGQDRRAFWGTVLRGCPFWVKGLLPLLVLYAMLNFFRSAGGPQDDPVLTMRMFSGHWMIFYFLSFAILGSYRRLTGIRL